MRRLSATCVHGTRPHSWNTRGGERHGQRGLRGKFWVGLGGDRCVGVLDPGHQLGVELLSLLRHLLGEIVFLGEVVTQVEKFVVVVFAEAASASLESDATDSPVLRATICFKNRRLCVLWLIFGSHPSYSCSLATRQYPAQRVRGRRSVGNRVPDGGMSVVRGRFQAGACRWRGSHARARDSRQFRNQTRAFTAITVFEPCVLLREVFPCRRDPPLQGERHSLD